MLFPSLQKGAQQANGRHDVQKQYAHLVGAMQSLPYSMLDVTARTWFADLHAFQQGVESLERQLIVLLQQGYESAGALTYKLSLLPVCSQLLLAGHVIRPYCIIIVQSERTMSSIV